MAPQKGLSGALLGGLEGRRPLWIWAERLNGFSVEAWTQGAALRALASEVQCSEDGCTRTIERVREVSPPQPCAGWFLPPYCSGQCKHG